jgi:hypothetical protein
MGYPTEIANSMPEQPDPPLREPFGARAATWWERFVGLFRRRKRTSVDFTETFHAGVDRHLPPISASEARAVDGADLERQLQDPS